MKLTFLDFAVCNYLSNHRQVDSRKPLSSTDIKKYLLTVNVRMYDSAHKHPRGFGGTKRHANGALKPRQQCNNKIEICSHQIDFNSN